MEEIEGKECPRLMIDQKELQAQVKIPYDEALIQEEKQPRSPYLTALSNSKGLLIYALRKDLIIVNQKGLMKLSNAAKGKEESSDIERPTLEQMQKDKEAIKISFLESDVGKDDIQRILLEEELDSKGTLLVIGFPSKVFVLDIDSLLNGDASIKKKYDFPGDSKLKTFCVINGTILILNEDGHVTSLSESLKLGDLNSMPIHDCNQQ